jgi:hypothetical protein
MPLIIGVDLSNSGSGFRNIAKREQSHAGGKSFAETGILGKHRTSTRKVGDTPVAEPPGPHLYMDGLGTRELRARGPDVLLVPRRRARDVVWLDQFPPAFPQVLTVVCGILRTDVGRKFEGSMGKQRQVSILEVCATLRSAERSPLPWQQLPRPLRNRAERRLGARIGDGWPHWQKNEGLERAPLQALGLEFRSQVR